MKVLCYILAFYLCFHICAAEFSEDLAMKLVNFAAASFIPPLSDNGINLANQCFNKSWPKGQWSNLTQYTIKPCANKFTDECQLLIITVSNPLNKVVIAFRGTAGKEQMQHESDESLMEYEDWKVDPSLGRVNKYFADASESVWGNHVEWYLNNYQGHKFHFTGHSLGGAIAALTALRARVQGLVTDENTVLYTYGEPRVGDSDLAKSFKTITEKYRIVHNTDLVPHLPFCWGITSDSCKDKSGKPYHQPQEIWYNNKNLKMDGGGFTVCSPTEGEDPHCSNSINAAEAGWNALTDRGFELHLHYYNHRLDVYGPAGCNSATSLGFSIIALTFLFILNLSRH